MQIHTPKRIIELDEEEKDVLIAALFHHHATLVRMSNNALASKNSRMQLAKEAATAIWLAEELEDKNDG